MRADAKIPRLPQNRATVTKQNIKSARSFKFMLPYTKVKSSTGKLENAITSSWLKADISFPATMSAARSLVVNINSSVCRSRSPLMLADVSAGIINIKRRNSRVATKAYSLRKLS